MTYNVSSTSHFFSAKTKISTQAINKNLSKPMKAGVSNSKNLNLNMQRQQQTNWCWAAVSVSVSLFYNAAKQLTQCQLVNQALVQSGCCTNGSSSSCNQPWYLDRALRIVNHLNRWFGSAITFAQLQQEINKTLPLGARIGWSGGGGHFVAIDGYDTSGGQFLSIRDPIYGSSTYTFAAFSTGYQGNGTWTDSYYTKP